MSIELFKFLSLLLVVLVFLSFVNGDRERERESDDVEFYCVPRSTEC